ncbi:MAG: hypothetical protein RLZZ184_4273 [Cyanobacteriota bacterium]
MKSYLIIDIINTEFEPEPKTMLIKDKITSADHNQQLFTELTSADSAIISGGIDVPTTNTIKKGRGAIRVDLRSGLKDPGFTGRFENCTADFDDFNGTLNITCNLSEQDVSGGQALYHYKPRK